jgi:hypothetical protein
MSCHVMSCHVMTCHVMTYNNNTKDLLESFLRKRKFSHEKGNDRQFFGNPTCEPITKTEIQDVRQ